MKNLLTLLLAISACANCIGSTTASVERIKLAGDSLPEITHIVDMKIVGDTLYFVYETPHSYGQRFLRSAIIDRQTKTLTIRPEIGKRANGYYQTDMPYPILGTDTHIKIISQDTAELFSLMDSTTLISDKQCLIGNDTTLPFPISSYVQDLFQLADNKYIFRGRKPNGGSQYAFLSHENGTQTQIDTLCQLTISPEYPSWTVNTGEMAYSSKDDKIAYAYKLHPVIDFFNPDGSKSASISVSAPTFDKTTLNQADFESLNPLHFVDLSQTANNLYALYWGHKYSDTKHSNKIYRLDWSGHIISEHQLPHPAQNIAALNDTTLLSFTGTRFILLTLPKN